MGAFEFKAKTCSFTACERDIFFMTIAAKPAMNGPYFIQELVQRLKGASIIYEQGEKYEIQLN